MSKIKKALPSEKQIAFRQEVLSQSDGRRRGRPEGPSFSDSWKAYKGSPEYKKLEEEIRNRRFVIEHLIWRAYAAGFKAKNGRKAEKEEGL